LSPPSSSKPSCTSTRPGQNPHLFCRSPPRGRWAWHTLLRPFAHGVGSHKVRPPIGIVARTKGGGLRMLLAARTPLTQAEICIL
jgi:hypothetical protein